MLRVQTADCRLQSMGSNDCGARKICLYLNCILPCRWLSTKSPSIKRGYQLKPSWSTSQINTGRSSKLIENLIHEISNQYKWNVLIITLYNLLLVKLYFIKNQTFSPAAFIVIKINNNSGFFHTIIFSKCRQYPVTQHMSEGNFLDVTVTLATNLPCHM